MTMVGEYLDDTVERVWMADHEGTSGALLERLTLADGRRLIIKRFSPDDDLLMAALGDVVGREYIIWSRGILTPLPDLLSLFVPDLMAPFVGSRDPLVAIVIHGWDIFSENVPADVVEPVLALFADPSPLAQAFQARPTTLVHGDLATVTLAVTDGKLTLLDWAMPAAAPGAVDIARFVAGCSSVIDAPREQIIAYYAAAAGPAYDQIAMRLSLLSGLIWLGWNKALDAAEHPDPVARAREQLDLDWWLGQARLTLEADLL